jgi:hypothetical protein
MQFLGNDRDVMIGEGSSETIIISIQPYEWTIPVGIDEAALASAASSRQEALTHALEAEEDDDDPDGSPSDD